MDRELGERLMAQGKAMRRQDTRPKPTTRDEAFHRVLAQAVSARTGDPVIGRTDPHTPGTLAGWHVQPSPIDRVREVVRKAVRELPRKVSGIGGTRNG